MPNDFSTEYSELTGDELLQLASERPSLITEAAVALDTELRRRNLTESDRVEHQKLVRRQERRESRGRRRKIIGKSQFSWRESLFAFAVMAAILWAYSALPKRYHLKPDWQEAAAEMMIVSVIVIVGSRSLWREMMFWVALILSSATQLAVVHTWVERAGLPSRGVGKLATLLGFVLFFAIYGAMKLLRRNFYGEASSKPDTQAGG